MKKTFLSAIFVFLTAVVYGQQTITSDNITDFHTVTLSGNLNVQLLKSEKESIEIVLYDTDISRLKWNIVNRILNVSLRSTGNNSGRADVKIYYVETPSDISVSGGQMMIDEPLEVPILRFTASGGAIVTASILTNDAEIDVSGNSVAQFSGSAKYLTVRAMDRSKVDMVEVESTSVDVDASTAAEVRVHAEERLIVNAKTNSTIFYKGDPMIIKDRSSKMNTSVLGSSVHNIGK